MAVFALTAFRVDALLVERDRCRRCARERVDRIARSLRWGATTAQALVARVESMTRAEVARMTPDERRGYHDAVVEVEQAKWQTTIASDPERWAAAFAAYNEKVATATHVETVSTTTAPDGTRSTARHVESREAVERRVAEREREAVEHRAAERHHQAAQRAPAGTPPTASASAPRARVSHRAGGTAQTPSGSDDDPDGDDGDPDPVVPRARRERALSCPEPAVGRARPPRRARPRPPRSPEPPIGRFPMPRSPFNLTRSVKLARSDVRALEHRAHVEGRRVSAARVALGLTQEQLAARVYVGRRMIAGVESGELALEPDGLARFARALGLTPSDLMHSSRLAREPTLRSWRSRGSRRRSTTPVTTASHARAWTPRSSS
jgi:DNA-binding transcriptional regulator YiaG